LLSLERAFADKRIASILCIGAHPDDIEIGCGGTVQRLLELNPHAHVEWVVLSSNEDRAAEARSAAGSLLESAASSRIRIEAFRESYFPYEGADVKRFFDNLGRETDPDLILTHHGNDLHQDHRLVAELTWNTWRDHLILEYEIPKYDGDLGRPNVFVALEQAQCMRKVEALMKFFPSQKSKYWFTEDTFWGLLRVRGVEARAPGGYAEGFYCRKLVLL
jgi:LmbE family N-acetylglucosaminyl deacetylase